MSFAEKQLAKFGWSQGEGLGKNKDGIKKSISVVKKNDTKGLGGKSDKWDFAWWDHVFNKSVSSIQVSKDESGEVKVEKQGSSAIQMGRMGIISTSRPAGPALASTPPSSASTPTSMGSMTPRDDYNDDDTVKPPPRTSGPSWLFGFVKASASSTAVEEGNKNNQGSVTSADSFTPRPGNYDVLKAAEADEYKDYSIKVSDQELFEACEGRTARKGARGEQPGKLGRVMNELLLGNGSEEAPNVEEVKAKEKKEKKEKKERKEKKEKKKDKKDKKDRKEKKEKESKDKKKDKKEKEGKVKKEKSSEKDKSTEKKEKKNKSADSTEKKSKKDGSKKRSADEDEPRTTKKLKKSKNE
ncbi:G patch domain-containing protein 4 [Mortierella sp. NVP85]|nr:G patch domain-containing protein 4 [Mortierella sp. NVP85]